MVSRDLHVVWYVHTLFRVHFLPARSPPPSLHLAVPHSPFDSLSLPGMVTVAGAGAGTVADDVAS